MRISNSEHENFFNAKVHQIDNWYLENQNIKDAFISKIDVVYQNDRVDEEMEIFELNRDFKVVILLKNWCIENLYCVNSKKEFVFLKNKLKETENYLLTSMIDRVKKTVLKLEGD